MLGEGNQLEKLSPQKKNQLLVGKARSVGDNS